MPLPEGKAGWYVEIDSDLMQKFDAMYPYRGAKLELTLLAINYALGRTDAANEIIANLQRKRGGAKGDRSSPRPASTHSEDVGTERPGAGGEGT